MDFFDLVKLFPVLESECRKERRNQYVRFVPRKILKNQTTFDSFISERVKEGVVKVGIVEETMIILLYHEGRLEITNPLAYTSSEIYAGDQTRFYLANFQNDPKGCILKEIPKEFCIKTPNDEFFHPFEFLLKYSPSYRVRLKKFSELKDIMKAKLRLSTQNYSCFSNPFTLRSKEDDSVRILSTDKLANESLFFRTLLFGKIGTPPTEFSFESSKSLQLFYLLVLHHADLLKSSVKKILSIILEYRLEWYETMLG